MKNTKKFLFSASLVIAIVLFNSTNISTMNSEPLTGWVMKHDAEIQKLKIDLEILKRTVEKLVEKERLAVPKS